MFIMQLFFISQYWLYTEQQNAAYDEIYILICFVLTFEIKQRTQGRKQIDR